jgi:hypothetical protein
MVATISPYRKKRLPIKAKDIPHYLIYEIMDGKPIYYEGFREVLSNKKTFEEIMGSSRLQARIVAVIVKDLNIRLSDDFEALSNEFGIHLNHKNNLCGDIGIFESSQFLESMDEDKYFDIPPKIVIEVDTKAAFEFIDDGEYYHNKTQKLLDFGVEKSSGFIQNPKK